MTTILQPGDYTVPAPPPPLPPVEVVKPKTILAGLQFGSFETLWGVGRTHPVNNPPVHGTVTQVPGTGNSPATYDFHPADLPNDNDNLYCLRRLITQVDQALLAKATKFTNSAWVKIDNLANCQAFEFDLPTPFNVGTMGIQLLPGKPSWLIRAFVYGKSWALLPGTSFDPTLLAKGSVFGGEYTIQNGVVTHTAVIIDGNRVPVNFTQNLGLKLTQPRFNAAFQMDANDLGKAYKVSLDNFQVSFE